MLERRLLVEGGICAFSLLLIELFAITALVPLANAITPSAAFIQTGEELHYFVNRGQPNEIIDGNEKIVDVNQQRDNNIDANKALQFDPATLQFSRRSIGELAVRKVKVRNASPYKIQFDNISGRAADFHVSFFDDKILPAGKTTTFSIAYLPRRLGDVNADLMINTSLGAVLYTVTGAGIASRYGVHSHDSFTIPPIPVNGSLNHIPIFVHNPHDRVLRIVEMYTSSPDVHLELPNQPGVLNADAKQAWLIEPHCTQLVMMARYIGLMEQNTTAFVRIRAQLIDKQTVAWPKYWSELTVNDEDTITLTIALDLEVTKKKGLYSIVPEVDFGKVRNDETTPYISLDIITNANKTIEITRIDIDNSYYTNAIKILHPSITPPNAVPSNINNHKSELSPILVDGACISCPSTIAHLSFNAKEARQAYAKLAKANNQELSGNETIIHLKGNILIVGKNRIGGGSKYRLSIPWKATIYLGNLEHEPIDTAVHISQAVPVLRNVTLRNTFSTTVAITNVTLHDSAIKHFNVIDFEPIVLHAKCKQTRVLSLLYKQSATKAFTSFIRINTNLSTFDIPLTVYSGHLQFGLSSIEQSKLDFGALSPGDSRSIVMMIVNENAVPIGLRQHRHSLQSILAARVLGTRQLTSLNVQERKKNFHNYMRAMQGRLNEGDINSRRFDANDIDDDWSSGGELIVEPNSITFVEFRLIAHRHGLGHIFGSIKIESANELKEFEVVYQRIEGSLVPIPSKLTLNNAYPYRTSVATVQVYSTFNQEMKLLRLGTLANDQRFHFDSMTVNAEVVVRPQQLSLLGRLVFTPHSLCEPDCYTGVPLHTDEGGWFRYGFHLPANLANIDAYVHSRLRQKWNALLNKHAKQVDGHSLVVQSIITIDTDLAKNIHLLTESRLVWPRLIQRHTVHFPLTGVGNFSVVNLTLHNTATEPVLIQILPLTIYPDPDAFLHYFKDYLPSQLSSNVEYNETLMFTLRDTELFPLRTDSPVPQLREELEDVLNQTTPRFTLSMIVKPNMRVRVRVGFLPRDYDLRSSLLIVRNNLTGVETVVLHGRGAKIDLRVANAPNRHSSPIPFELTESVLSECFRLPQNKRYMTPITVQHRLKVWNAGQVPLTITNITISGRPCWNIGFRVTNCNVILPMKLLPNDTAQLKIAYTPDFLANESDALLQLHAQHNSTPWTYYMQATIPNHLLPLCQSVMPRPRWEPLAYFFFVFLCMIINVTVLASAYLEGDRFVTCAHRQLQLQRSNFKPFDLSRIADTNTEAKIVAQLPPELLQNAYENNRLLMSADGDADVNEAGGILPMLGKKLKPLLLSWLDKILSRLRDELAANQEHSAAQSSQQKKDPIINTDDERRETGKKRDTNEKNISKQEILTKLEPTMRIRETKKSDKKKMKEMKKKKPVSVQIMKERGDSCLASDDSETTNDSKAYDDRSIASSTNPTQQFESNQTDYRWEVVHTSHDKNKKQKEKETIEEPKNSEVKAAREEKKKELIVNKVHPIRRETVAEQQPIQQIQSMTIESSDQFFDNVLPPPGLEDMLHRPRQPIAVRRSSSSISSMPDAISTNSASPPPEWNDVTALSGTQLDTEMESMALMSTDFEDQRLIKGFDAIAFDDTASRSTSSDVNSILYNDSSTSMVKALDTLATGMVPRQEPEPPGPFSLPHPDTQNMSSRKRRKFNRGKRLGVTTSTSPITEFVAQRPQAPIGAAPRPALFESNNFEPMRPSWFGDSLWYDANEMIQSAIAPNQNNEACKNSRSFLAELRQPATDNYTTDVNMAVGKFKFNPEAPAFAPSRDPSILMTLPTSHSPPPSTHQLPSTVDLMYCTAQKPESTSRLLGLSGSLFPQLSSIWQPRPDERRGFEQQQRRAEQ